MRRAIGEGCTTEWACVSVVIVRTSPVLHPVERLDVDVGEAEHRDEKDNRERRGIAGTPLFERLALQRDRGHFRSRARATRGQQVHHVEHLEVFDAAEEYGEHDEW